MSNQDKIKAKQEYVVINGIKNCSKAHIFPLYSKGFNLKIFSILLIFISSIIFVICWYGLNIYDINRYLSISHLTIIFGLMSLFLDNKYLNAWIWDTYFAFFVIIIDMVVKKEYSNFLMHLPIVIILLLDTYKIRHVDFTSLFTVIVLIVLYLTLLKFIKPDFFGRFPYIYNEIVPLLLISFLFAVVFAHKLK